MRSLAKISTIIWLALMQALVSATVVAGVMELRPQLERLASTHDFELRGSDNIADAPVDPQSLDGTLEQQLRALLSNYNFAILRDDSDRVVTVVVSGQRKPPPAISRNITVQTTRRGSSHFLEAVLIGDRPDRVRTTLMLDTGASVVVLPSSMMRDLGIRAEDVTPAELQTANGQVRGMIGELRRVEVGRAVAENIAVAFVDDEKLGGNKLLGMSFLGLYVLTIDDKAGILTFQERDQ